MGQKQSKASSSAAPNNRKMTPPATTNNTAETAPPSASEIGEYNLKKHHPGCTGMFWRADPTGATGGLANNNDWPRDGAVLRGRVVTVAGKNKNEKWLLATAVKQAGSSQWKDAPQGAALPFEYNNHYYLEKA